MANIVDAAMLVEDLTRYRVVDPARLATARAGFIGEGAAALAEHLISSGQLTAYQAREALAGNSRRLTLGPYRLTQSLCKGSLGTVFVAADTTGTKSFAVRLLPLRSLWQVKVAKRLVRSLATLPAHPTIVPLADVDTANGLHYLVWPWIAGESLVTHVNDSGPLSAVDAAKMLRRLAEGLAVCHKRGVEHGLINPQNILFSPDGQTRLLELGAGQLLAQNLADAESMVDTLSEATAGLQILATGAPELIADPTAISPAVDQYGLGVVAHYALTGLLPYEEEGLTRTLISRQVVASCLCDLDPSIPVELGRVVDRMLALEPEARYGSMDEVAGALSSVLEELGEAPPSAQVDMMAEVPASQGHITNRSSTGSRDSSRSGSVSWSGQGGPESAIRPVERDESNDSITFDLPEVLPESMPPGPIRTAVAATRNATSQPYGNPFNALTPSPEKALPLQQADTPSSALHETQPPPGSTPNRNWSATPPHEDPTPLPVAPPPQVAKYGESLLLNSVRDNSPAPLLAALPIVPPPSSAKGSGTTETEESKLPKLGPAGSGFRRKPKIDAPLIPEPAAAEEDVTQSVLWKTVRRNLLFWQAATDRVQVSVFGPPTVVPGQTAPLEVFLHQPDAAENVRTMARAFILGAGLLGTGFVAREIPRGSKIAIHISLANAGLSKTLLEVEWKGQPQRLSLEAHAPWESPPGTSEGVVSIGLDNVRVGRVDFQVNILPRTS